MPGVAGQRATLDFQLVTVNTWPTEGVLIVESMTLFAPMYASLLVASGRIRHRHLCLAPLTENLKVIAHRGASHQAPENTLASVELAWQQGADAVEVDVHLTRDRRIVAIHDPTTDRTAGTHLEVAATHSSRLRRLDVGRHKDPRFTGERIPYLEEVLRTVPAGRQLFVEIKCGPEILPPLADTVTRSGKRSQIVLIGFDLDTMRAAKKIMPDVPACWLCDKRILTSYSRSLARQAQAGGVDGLDVHWSGVTRRFIRAVKAAGLRLYIWTVDDPAQAARLKTLGADGITTNRPSRLRREIAVLSSR